MNRHRGQTRTVWHVSSPSGLLFCQLPELPRPARGGLRRAVRRHPGHVLPRWSRSPYARARDEINEELRLAGTLFLRQLESRSQAAGRRHPAALGRLRAEDGGGDLGSRDHALRPREPAPADRSAAAGEPPQVPFVVSLKSE